MKNKKYFLVVLSVAFALACVNVSVSGQSAEKIASVAASGASVRWEVSVPNAGVSVSVAAPDGKVYRKEFKAGESPVFDLFDKKGNRLPDGQYTYELRLAPVLSPELRKELAAARDKDEDAADEVAARVRSALPAYPLVQSGSFSVLRGSVILGGGVEPGQRRTARTDMRRRGGLQSQPYVQTESFIQQAVFVPERAAVASVRSFAHPAFPDDVVPDDQIVQGSECVGLDCVNGEVFGFDTVRLKENNTRLQFDDTSTSQGYPTNNWQIRANDSGAGGESFLGFVDQGASGNSETGTVVFLVNAGAPANSIKVDSTGRVGMRTATPGLDIHVNTGNTPAIRFEQNASGGWGTQTWDIGANEANFFVRDLTGGSRLPFRIRPGAPTSSIDIANNSEVGIMTASPLSTLDVAGNALHVGSESGATTRTNNTTKLSRFAVPPYATANLSFAAMGAATTATDNAVAIGGSAAGFAAATYIIFNTAATNNVDTGTERMRITSAGLVGIGTSAPTDTLSVNGTASKPGGGSWSVFSDERLKNIKGQFNSGLSAVMQLQPLRYEYRRDNALGLKSPGEHVGFGAQAVQKIIPEAVTSTEQGYLVVNNDPIIWAMLNAIKEQQKEIEQLKAEVRRLRPASRRRR